MTRLQITQQASKQEKISQRKEGKKTHPHSSRIYLSTSVQKNDGYHRFLLPPLRKMPHKDGKIRKSEEEENHPALARTQNAPCPLCHEYRHRSRFEDSTAAVVISFDFLRSAEKEQGDKKSKPDPPFAGKFRKLIVGVMEKGAGKKRKC